MLPGQRPRFLGPHSGQQAQRDVRAKAVLLQIACRLEQLLRLVQRQRLRRPPGLAFRGVDQRRDIPAHQVASLSMPDRAGQRVVRDRHRGAGTILPEHGQRVPHIVRGQVPKRRMAGELQDRLEHVPVLRDGGSRPAVEPVAEPVIDGLPHGVGGGRPHSDSDLLAEIPELVTNLGLGAAADGPAPALAVRGEAERHRRDPVAVGLVEVDAVLAAPAPLDCHAARLALGSDIGSCAELVRTTIWALTWVGLGGLEPPTSSLSGKRSNRLSYRPSGVAAGTDRAPPGQITASADQSVSRSP